MLNITLFLFIVLPSSVIACSVSETDSKTFSRSSEEMRNNRKPYNFDKYKHHPPPGEPNDGDSSASVDYDDPSQLPSRITKFYIAPRMQNSQQFELTTSTDACLRTGGVLAEIKSLSDWEAAKDVLSFPVPGQVVWINLRYNPTTATWQWLYSGEDLGAFNKWALIGNQQFPLMSRDNSFTDECVVTDSDFGWQNAPCTSDYAFEGKFGALCMRI